MIRVVIDTNVLVSSALKAEGNEARVLELVQANRIVPCVTAAILDEYAAVMSRRKFGLSRMSVDSLLAGIREKGRFFVLNSFPRMSPDPDDDEFIACAMTVDAEFIVTGNRRHYPRSSTAGRGWFRRGNCGSFSIGRRSEGRTGAQTGRRGIWEGAHRNQGRGTALLVSGGKTTKYDFFDALRHDAAVKLLSEGMIRQFKLFIEMKLGQLNDG